MRVICIIQARMGSTRLPGKVMADLVGETVLARCVNRSRRARLLDQVVVATTVETADDEIVAYCKQQDIQYTRGSEADVLDRYFNASKQYNADVIVRITSDCPIIDPWMLDSVVAGLLNRISDLSYCSNTIPVRTFPRGLDVECFTFQALKVAWNEATSESDREHVTPFIWKDPVRFPQRCMRNDTDYSSLRWTVDTPEDLELIRLIYRKFNGDDEFSWHEALELMNLHPEWCAVNSHIEQKNL